MNLRKLKNQAGFTLVELIVVIAIMAILAGVAVPVYSGYIEKAEKAGDLQLLGAVNSAFGAAAVENGTDIYQINSATPVANERVITGMTGVSAPEGVSGDAIAASFVLYYEGNGSSAFKTSLPMFDAIKHSFVLPGVGDGETVTLYYNGNYVAVSGEAIQAVQNSTYGEIGAETLLGQVDSVTQLTLASILGDGGTFQKVVYTEEGELRQEYFEALADTLNMDMTDLVGHVSKFETTEQLNNFLANSLILTAAGAAADKDVDYVTDILKSDADKYIEDIKKNLTNPATAQDALADAALIYGVYTSYVYATDPDGAQEKLNAVNGSAALTDALEEMQGEDFADYMENGSGKSDLNAYLEAMKVVDSAAGNPDAALSVMDKGFDDPELTKLLQSVMGK